MRRVALAIAAAALAAACEPITGISGQKYLLLSGVWSASTSVPGTSGVKMATAAAAGHITGIGVAYTMDGVDTLRIEGQYDASNLTFGLDITSDAGRSAAFSGQIQSTASLTGYWTDWSTGSGSSTTFTRLLVPPCDDSVPLTGTYDPNAPGFIVTFRDDVNATVEAASLGDLYGFTPTQVWNVAPQGFLAVIPMATVTVLRCEPSVTSVAYNTTVAFR